MGDVWFMIRSIGGIRRTVLTLLMPFLLKGSSLVELHPVDPRSSATSVPRIRMMIVFTKECPVDKMIVALCFFVRLSEAKL